MWRAKRMAYALRIWSCEPIFPPALSANARQLEQIY